MSEVQCMYKCTNCGAHRMDVDGLDEWRCYRCNTRFGAIKETMTNEQAVEWAKRAKSMCEKSIDGDAATLLHWTEHSGMVQLAIANLRIVVKEQIDQRARRAFNDNRAG